MNLKLLKLKHNRSVFRALTILLLFIPAFICENDWAKEFCNKYIAIWFIFTIVLFLFQIFFIKRYQIIGNIKFRPSLVEIIYQSGKTEQFGTEKISEMVLNYKGYKGEGETFFPLFWFLNVSEGINELILVHGSKKKVFNVLINKNEIRGLKVILKRYSELESINVLIKNDR